MVGVLGAHRTAHSGLPQSDRAAATMLQLVRLTESGEREYRAVYCMYSKRAMARRQ
jgi:hypothetical protein